MADPADDPKCEICTVLWREYLAAAHLLISLESKLEIAGLEQDTGVMQGLLTQVEVASERRASLGEQIDAHRSSAHPGKRYDAHGLAKELTDKLNRATDEYLRLMRIGVEIIREAPNGIPLPDGQLRIIQAGAKVHSAFEHYQRAVRQYTDFVEKGIVPDLKEEDL